ncbi:hypothetical protein DY000_02059025 [Brassica cretica]|uniref:Uncharacterized protein n=1 Tax=Brassica cretica TaxID=69181 RepID=A0ABQ7B3H4_BRACR|nr:hypothetical protein DY000_02059025 [Brassica cretica]
MRAACLRSVISSVWSEPTVFLGFDPINTEPSREEPVQESSDRETAEPSATDGNKKKRSAPGSSASVEARTGTEFNEPPKKKKKKEKKKKKKMTTTSSGPLSLIIPPALTADPVNTEPSREEPVQESSDRETAEPSATDGNKKKRSAPGSSASVEARTGTESDEPPNKKEKKEKRKKKKRTVEERSEPSEDVGGRELVPLDSSNRNVVAQTSVDLDDSPSVPLERKKKSSREGDAPTSVEKSPPAVPSATRSSGSASKGGRIKFPDHVEFKYDGDTPLAYAPT